MTARSRGKQQPAAPAITIPDISNLLKLNLESNVDKVIKDSGLPNAIAGYFSAAAELNGEAKRLIGKLTQKKVPNTPKKKLAATNKILEEISSYRRIDFDDDDASFLSAPSSPPRASPAKARSPSRPQTPAKVNAPLPAAKVNTPNQAVSKVKPPWRIPPKVTAPMPLPPPAKVRRLITPAKVNLPSRTQAPAKAVNPPTPAKAVNPPAPAKAVNPSTPAKAVNPSTPAKAVNPPSQAQTPAAKAPASTYKLVIPPLPLPPPPKVVVQPPSPIQAVAEVIPARPLPPVSEDANAEVNKSSYDMTLGKVFLPSTETNYNVDDLSSNDETDDEQQPRKTVPAWAKRQTLNPFIREMLKTKTVDVMADYFAPVQQPTLTTLFNMPNYRYRNSSSVWQSPLHQPTAGFSRLPFRR